MTLSNPVAKEVVYGGHLLAIGTASIAGASALLLGDSPTIPLLLMAYLFSFGAYMLNRGSEVSQDSISNPLRTGHLQSRSKYLLLISGASFGVGYVIAFFANLIFFAVLLVPLALAILYSAGSKKLFGSIGTSRLKEKLLVKNIAISFGWSLIPILVGLYYGNISLVLLCFAPFVFLRLMSNTIFFDLRDLDADRRFGVKTIPVVYGATLSNSIMNLMDALSAAYIVSLFALGYLPLYTLSLLLLPLYSFAYRLLPRYTSINLNIVCDLIADGEYLLWGPLLLAGKMIL